MNELTEFYQKQYHETEEKLFHTRMTIARSTGRMAAIIETLDKIPLDHSIKVLKEIMESLEESRKDV